MRSLHTLLQNHAFFKEFLPQQIDKIANDASEDSFHPNQYIFKAWQEANQFYLICKGRVSLEVFVPKQGPATLDIINAGDVLGWSWLHPPYRWHFDARALEQTHAIVLDGEALRSKIEENRELGFKFMKRIAAIMEKRLQATRLKLIELYGIFPSPDESWTGNSY